MSIITKHDSNVLQEFLDLDWNQKVEMLKMVSDRQGYDAGWAERNVRNFESILKKLPIDQEFDENTFEIAASHLPPAEQTQFKMMKLKDLLKEGKETVQDIHVEGVIAMFKRGLENEGRWRLADGVRAKKLAQAYRFLDRIDKTVFGKPGAKESGKMRQELDIKLFQVLRKNYDTDSMKKINLAFQKHSKGY